MHIEFPFFVFVILVWSKRRYGMKTTATAAGLFAAVYMLASIFVVANWREAIHAYPTWEMTYKGIGLLLMALAALCLTRQRWVQSLFVIASAYVLITVTDALSAIAYLAFDWRLEITEGLLYVVFALAAYFSRKPVTRILGQTKKGWWLLCSVPFLLVGSFFVISAVPVTITQNPAVIPTALVFCGTTIIVYTTFFYMMWQLYKQAQLEQNVMALRMSVTDLEAQNELIQQNERRYALFKHDVRHIMQMISASLSQNDINGANEWLKPLMENVNAGEHYPIRSFTGHTLPDAVLSRYIQKAADMGIDISVRIGGMGPIKADMTELAVVLANALENAVTACESAHEKTIRIDGQQRGAQFFLEIANTYGGEVVLDEETGLPTSASLSPDGGEHSGEHGLGTQSIAFFAQKHEALLQYHIQAPWFRLRLLM
jgi:signal transduction histidine kinase